MMMRRAIGTRIALALVLAVGLSAARAQEAQPAAAVVKVACVGDSITAGYGAGAQESYPVVLGKLLGSGYAVGNFGVSGATLMKKGDLPYWGLDAFKKTGDFAPNLVVLMLGTNDSKDRNWAGKDAFADDYRAMLEYFRQLPSKPKVWVCLPAPVYGKGAFGITDPVVKNEIIPLITKVANEMQAPVIDVNAALSNHPELFPDTVHPNAAGYRLLAETIAKAIAPPAK